MSIYVFDLDGTLCRTEGREYGASEPILERIGRVNKLYAEGHTIIIDTARGTVTGHNHYQLTMQQLADWGVRYHDLIVGRKPYGDFYIEDKGIRDDQFFV